jgi:hypothetical protein
MALIVVFGTGQDHGDHRAELSEADEDGEYTFSCTHGREMIERRPLDEVLSAAEIHVDGGWGWD